jgi:hypothetical protein
MHHVLALANMRRLPEADEEASHLCNNTKCMVFEHVVWEPKLNNQQRKNCPIWTDCSHEEHCMKKVWVCSHEPPCIKRVPGQSWAGWLADAARDEQFHYNEQFRCPAKFRDGPSQPLYMPPR